MNEFQIIVAIIFGVIVGFLILLMITECGGGSGRKLPSINIEKPCPKMKKPREEDPEEAINVS